MWSNFIKWRKNCEVLKLIKVVKWRCIARLNQKADKTRKRNTVTLKSLDMIEKTEIIWMGLGWSCKKELRVEIAENKTTRKTRKNESNLFYIMNDIERSWTKLWGNWDRCKCNRREEIIRVSWVGRKRAKWK